MKINEIQLLTNDLESTEHYYNQILDIVTIYKNDQEVVFSTVKSKITFLKSKISNPNYHLAFDIPTNKLDEAFESLSKKTLILPISGQTYISDIRHWNAKSFYFYDNNGNLLELIARFDNQHTSGEQFNGKSVLNVSEIGIVTDNVSQLSAKFIRNYGLQSYAKQPPTVDFAALGDEHGLFIIVGRNRAWYPTNRKAGEFPINVKFNVSNPSVIEFVLRA
jgi:catechol-2,3-dioxygenase